MTAALESATADREIVTTRWIRAPRELVFEAFTKREHVDHWWGPRGFTTTTSDMEVSPGGSWRFTMHGPDGIDYPNRIDYHEIVRPSLITYAHGSDGAKPNGFHTRITLEEEAGGTRLTMRATLQTAEAREYEVKHHDAVEGAKQTIDRLEVFLEGQS